MTLSMKRKIDVNVFIYIRTYLYLQSELIWGKKPSQNKTETNKTRTPILNEKFAHLYQKSEIVETEFDLYHEELNFHNYSLLNTV